MITNIKPNETSFAVAQLHLVIQLLHLPVNNRERLAKKAGPTTQEILRVWQKQQQIPGNSNLLVDIATATALSRALSALGYLNSKLRNTVLGTV